MLIREHAIFIFFLVILLECFVPKLTLAEHFVLQSEYFYGGYVLSLLGGGEHLPESYVEVF